MHPKKKKPKVSTASTLRGVSSNSMMDEELDCESMATAAFSGVLGDSPAGPAPRDSTSSADRVPGNTAGAERQLEPPPWFQAFENRLESRFALLLSECREKLASMEMDMANLKDEVSQLSAALKKSDEKIDELENRSRRNNIVLFNIQEKAEGDDCIHNDSAMLRGTGCPEAGASMQRAHESGRPSRQDNPRPRPIHVGFNTYLMKEKARKALVELFKRKKAATQGGKWFVSDDFHYKVQQMRKEMLPKLIQLRKEGRIAFLAYPAKIRIRDN